MAERDPIELVELRIPNGRYDAARRRQSVREGRERGCWVYIPAEELASAGIDPHGPAPMYRVWGRRGSALIALYRAEVIA